MTKSKNPGVQAIERAIANAGPYVARPVGSPEPIESVTVHTGDPVEVRTTDGMWWQGRITGCGRKSVRAALGFNKNGAGAPIAENGMPIADAILPAALYGKTWRLSTLAVHRVPLTGQGVRNLNMAAAPALRNGRHFRKPRNWMVICPHPHHMLLGEEVEELIYHEWVKFDRLGNPVDAETGRIVPKIAAVALRLYFDTCGDCGAAVPA